MFLIEFSEGHTCLYCDPEIQRRCHRLPHPSVPPWVPTLADLGVLPSLWWLSCRNSLWIFFPANFYKRNLQCTGAACYFCSTALCCDCRSRFVSADLATSCQGLCNLCSGQALLYRTGLWRSPPVWTLEVGLLAQYIQSLRDARWVQTCRVCLLWTQHPLLCTWGPTASGKAVSELPVCSRLQCLCFVSVHCWCLSRMHQKGAQMCPAVRFGSEPALSGTRGLSLLRSSWFVSTGAFI